METFRGGGGFRACRKFSPAPGVHWLRGEARPRTVMALPTFFIIGAAKAGTTSLHLYLDQHPQIQMSANKEPRFFAGPEDGVPYAPGRIARLDEYEALFDDRVLVRGESSTDYAIHPRRTGVPQRIKAMVPGARFVYLVRDPIDRIVSHYRMRVAFLGERRPLEDAIDFKDRRSPYVWPSLYASQLERFLREFPQERFVVLDQHDLLHQRRATLRRVFAFLGVDVGFDSARFDDHLSSGSDFRAYPPAYARLVEHVLAPAARRLPGGVRQRLAVAQRRVWPEIPEPALPEPLRIRLAARLEPEAHRLRTLTGQPFPGWSV